MSIDPTKLLGFRLIAQDKAAGKPVLGAKVGNKAGVKVTGQLGTFAGAKIGTKTTR